ncbi:MAG: DUF3298 and DUF4163 domain-containing protein [Rhodothermaceae bacterium]
MKNLFFSFIVLFLTACGVNQQIKLEEKEISDKIEFSENRSGTVQFLFPQITDLPEDSPLNNINSVIVEQLKGTEKKPLETIQKEFIKEYKEFIDEFPSSPQSWEIKKDIKTVMKTDNLLSLTLTDFSYTGGAHPNTFVTHLCFDLKTGKRISLEDLITKEKMNELNILAEKKFRSDNNFNETSNYQEEGYFVENGKLKVNDNFLITNDGLTFLFNSYEIAPYSTGRTKIHLKLSELKGLLKNNYFFNN